MSKKATITLVSTLLLFVVMGGLVLITTQKGGGKFDIRNRASTPTGTAELIITPTTHQYYIGDYFRLDMMLNTGGKAISGVGFRLSYPFTTAVPEIEVRDNDSATANTQIQSFATTLNADLVPNVNIVTLSPLTNGITTIDYSALTSAPTGYSNTSGQKLAQINFLARRAGTFTIQHDPQRSQISDKANGLDVLKTISPAVIKVNAETQAPQITITHGLAENASTISATINYEYTATDLPARQTNVFTPLTTTHKFDAETAPAYVALANNKAVISKVLGHGAHTLTIYVKDPEGNIGTVVRHFTVNATPHIDSITPTEGPAGSQITINGYNFTGTIVKFGTVPVVAATGYISRSATQMVVAVPVNAASPVTVTNTTSNPNLVSNAVAFIPRTQLTFLLPLQGIPTDKGAKVATKVVVKCGTFTHTFVDRPLVWGTGNLVYRFSEFFPTTTVVPTSATCTISVKETSRLRKKFTGITLAPTINNIIIKKTDADMMLVGDFDNNNILEMQDFGLLMANFTATSGISTPATDATRKFDLNSDGTISIEDVALLLTNFTALQKTGDPE